MIRLLLRVAIALVVSLVAFPTWAANLVSVQRGTLPPVEDKIVRLFVVGETPVALGERSTWVFATGAWKRVDWRPAKEVVGVAGGGFLLLGAGDRVEQVERVSFAGDKLESQPLPPLPESVLGGQGAVMGDVFYLAAPKSVLAVNLIAPSWRTYPGCNRAVTSAVAQNSGLWVTAADGALLRWSERDGWQEKGTVPGAVIGARATGQAHLLYLLPDGLSTYQTITGSWAPLAEVPGARLGAGYKNGFLWEHPGGLSFAEIESGKHLLAWLDWIVIGVYLASMLGIGLYFYRLEKRASTSDFFVGGRKIPFWAAGVSLYAANTSSISYIAIPAKSFETNWQYLTNSLITVLGLIFVAIWIVPILRRLDLMSVFQYLETRFHPAIRTLASGLFIAVQIGSRMSVILFLPSLAIATMTGLDVVWSIVIMGTFTIVYTALGGMKAVIWTDVVQLIVKMGGIVFAIGFILSKLHGGFGQLVDVAAAANKTKLLDFSFDVTKATVWGFIFLVLFEVVLTFPKDQVLMQRVLSTKSDKDAGRSVWTFAAIMIPGGLMFYTVGTALYVFYKAYPERMNPLMTIDATFPLFIAAELPMGVRGLIVAGILAAAMATLSGIMNSVATLASVDFYEKLVKNPNPKVSVRFAEAMTVVTGVSGMAVAWVLSRYDVHSLFDISLELGGLLGGGFAGAYTLGMFTRRANWQGVVIGVAFSLVVTTTAAFLKLIHPYFYLALSIFICVVVGYLASWLFPAPRASSLVGLTIRRT